MAPLARPAGSPRASKEAIFSRVTLVLSAAGTLAAGAWVMLETRPSAVGPKRLAFAGACLLLAAFLLLALRFSRDARTVLSVTMISVVVAAYVSELTLRWFMTQDLWKVAQRLGLPYDGRSMMEVVRDLRREGEMAYPEAHPINLLPRSRRDGFMPLSGVANATTVLCNETGAYVTYVSDEHGFRNPAGLWTGERLQVAAVGDSFTHGMCVADGRSAIDRIRRSYPRTLNLGISGDGPLLELATLEEYLPPLRPARVIWFFFEGNDLDPDLDVEARHPILRRYLTPGFTQNLAARQAEADTTLRGWLAEAQADVASKSGAGRAKFWRDLLTLQQLQRAVLLRMPGRQPPRMAVDIELFRQILEQASRTVSAWDGRLYFAYLPWQARFRDAARRKALDDQRSKVLATVRELGIPMIDLQPVVEAQGGASLYVPRPAGHFTARGYEVVAEAILKSLRDDEKRAGEASSGPVSKR